MSSPALLSDASSRRQSKIHRLSKKAELSYSDYYPEIDSTSLGGKRSISLTTLQQASPAVNEPRMAQLETLEAKMASIEVSLSTTPRRKKNGSIGGGSIGGSSKISLPRGDSISRELDNLRHALRDKENVIQNLKGQLNHSTSPSPSNRLSTGILRANGINNGRVLTPMERKQVEERLHRVKSEMDNKRLAIKNLKIALERLDITDNIDVRIQQAELEYQLGREELNALSLLEEARTLQLCLEDAPQTPKPQATLYGCTRGSNGSHVTLHAVDVKYDAKSPRFGAAQKDNNPGLFVDWALDDTELRKGDRVVEVNGKIVLNKSKEDMLRLLSVSPDPAQIVVLRLTPNPQAPYLIQSQPFSSATSNEVANLRAELGLVRERAEEAQRTKDGLKGDNLRLTHRISYLEEQVNELLQRNKTSPIPKPETSPVISTVKSSQNITNISISSPPSSPSNRNSSSSTDLQIFQKGPQVTALVANLPGMENDRDMLRTLRPRSNVSSTHIPAPQNNRRHHHHHLDYNSENDLRKHNSHNHHYRKNYENMRKIRDSRSADELDQQSEPTSRSIKSLDFDSEPNNNYAKPLKLHSRNIDYTSEPLNDKQLQHYQNGEIVRYSSRPKPPKKPIRLSLHRAQSLQSVEGQITPVGSMQQLNDRHQKIERHEKHRIDERNGHKQHKIVDDRKPVKRNHKGDQAPMNGGSGNMVKVERPTEQPPQPPQRYSDHHSNYESSNSRASSRNESHSALRWPSALQHITFSRSSHRNNNGHVSDGGKWC